MIVMEKTPGVKRQERNFHVKGDGGVTKHVNWADICGMGMDVAGINGGQKEENSSFSLWLTDERQEAVRLQEAGECVVFVLTPENGRIWVPEISYCVEIGEEAAAGGGTVKGRTEGQKPDWTAEISAAYLYRVWQRHKGLPWHILDTRRLSLREMTEADLDALYEIHQEEESRIFMESPEKDRETEREKMREYIRCMYGFYGFGIWMIEEKKTERVVGRAGLQLREGCTEPELGFAIAPAFRGRGYAEEACRAVLRYGFEELEFPVIRAAVHRDNEKSLRLCEKLGFLVDKEIKFDKDVWIGLKMEQKNGMIENKS